MEKRGNVSGYIYESSKMFMRCFARFATNCTILKTREKDQQRSATFSKVADILLVHVRISG